jgi:acetylornithine deacetylase/succinyl-diaminopimelate desuccinylase-like protein
MRLIESFVNKKEELGYKKAIQASLTFLFRVAGRKISALPYYVTGMIDYHFNPSALKQSNIEPFIDNEKIKCKSFAVDLHLPPDKNDPRLIECDATNMPFDDESISKIALHCA